MGEMGDSELSSEKFRNIIPINQAKGAIMKSTITIMGPHLLSKDSQDMHTNQASRTDSEEATITHVRKSLNININQNFLWITG